MKKTRIFILGNLIYIQDNNTLDYKAYPRESIVVQYSNGRYYFKQNNYNVFSVEEYNIIDQNGAPFSSNEEFENSISGGDAVEGYAVHRTVSAASTNEQVIATSPVYFAGGIFTNTTAGAKFVKYYNKATAPTVGTDIPLLTISIPANDSKVIELQDGVYFSNGISMAITGAGADSDTTNTAANDIIAQTFIEGLVTNELASDITTSSTVAGTLSGDGELAGAIATSSVVSATLIDQP